MNKRLQIKLVPVDFSEKEFDLIGRDGSDKSQIQKMLSAHEKSLGIQIEWSTKSPYFDSLYVDYKNSTKTDFEYLVKWLEEKAQKDIITSKGNIVVFNYSFDILGLFNKNKTIEKLRRVFMTSDYKKEIHTNQKILKQTAQKYIQEIFFILKPDTGPDWINNILEQLCEEVCSTKDLNEWLLNKFGSYIVNQLICNSSHFNYEESKKFFNFWTPKTTGTQKLKYLYRSPFITEQNRAEILSYIASSNDWKLRYYYEYFDKWTIKNLNYNIKRLEKELNFINKAPDIVKNAIKNNFKRTGITLENKVILEKLDIIYKTLNFTKSPCVRDLCCIFKCSFCENSVMIIE